jgi:hypothetical protein
MGGSPVSKGLDKFFGAVPRHFRQVIPLAPQIFRQVLKTRGTS